MADVGTVRLGRQRSPDTVSDRFPTKYLRAANITSNGLDLTNILEMDFDPVERQIYALRAGDILLAEASGSATQVGRAAIWSEELPDCCFQNTVLRFRPHAVDPQYAMLVFQHFAIIGAFANTARGVGIQHLGSAPFAQMPFPVPPLAEQRRIAIEARRRLQDAHNARDAIESALRRTTQQDNTILEAAALGGLIDPTTFVAVSLPLDANSERQRGLFAEQDQGGSGPTSEFADLLSRPLPPNWRWVRVDQAGEVRLGRQRAPQHQYGDHILPYLRVANVFEDHINVSDVNSMNFSPQEQEIYRLAPGDILLNEGQSPELIGRPAMYTGDPPNACFQNTLVRFRHGVHVDPHFALLVFRHYFRSGQFTRIARWSTNIAHLGAQRFAAMPFPIPPSEEQSQIVLDARSRLDASKAQRHAVESSLERLDEMRREIIRSAISGALVPQRPSEEPVAVLLSRLGPPAEPKPVREGKERRMPRRSKSVEGSRPPLYETLVAFQGPVPPEQLFKAAGYDPDSIADVERFYLDLREEFGTRIEQRESDDGARLEVRKDAAR